MKTVAFTSVVTVFRHRRLPAVILYFFCLTQAVSAQVARLFSLPPKERVAATFLHLWAVPHGDVFTKTADSIRRQAEADGDERLALYTRLFAARRQSEQAGQQPLAKNPLFREKEVFEESVYPDVKAFYNFYLAEYYENRHDYPNAFHHLIAATDEFEKFGWRNVPLAVFIASSLFDVYYHYEDYPTAIRFAQIALANADRGTYRPTHLLSNMGEAYLKLKDVAKAQDLFRQVMQMARESGDTAYVGIASGNYGNTLRLQGRYREALPYLYFDVALNQARVQENSAINCAYIADCLLHLDSVEKAGQYLQMANRLKIDYQWSWAPYRTAYYEAAALFHKRQGQFREALLYQDSLLAVKDSLKERFNTSILLTTSITLKEQKRLTEQRQKELEAANLRHNRNVIVGGLVLLFAATLGLVLHRRRLEREQFQARQRQAEEKLQQAGKDLEQYLAIIKEKTKLLTEVETKLATSSRPRAGNTEVAPPMQAAFTHLTLLTEADWRQFTSLFLAVYPQFFSDLEQRYPGLSLNDQRLLALLKLQLTSHEMAGMLGISLESLRKSRYRLRKKHPALAEDKELVV